MNISHRVKKLRFRLHLSQEDFGNRIGIKSRAHISALENGTRNVTDRIVKDICANYHVSEQWLRNGTGNMFEKSDNTIRSLLKDKYDADALDLEIIEQFFKLKPEKRQIIKEYILSIASAYQEALATKQKDTEKSIDEQVEAFRHELEAEKTTQTYQVLPDSDMVG